MRLKRIEIDNYKSLRGIAFEPGPLSVLVGPNAAGKTNFCDALDFLSHVYQWNLEEAVAYKGGYENICFRDGRGLSKDPIRFRLVLTETSPEELLFDHVFEFGVKEMSSPIYSVISEAIRLSPASIRNRKALRLSRNNGRVLLKKDAPPAVRSILDLFGNESDWLSDRELLFPNSNFGSAISQRSPAGLLKYCIGNLRVLQINAIGSRASGVPNPDPNLERFGGNLPAVIQYLKRNHPDEYAQIVHTLKEVLSDVEDLDVIVTHARTLALSVQGTDQPWPAEDLSDGTIQAIATLTAVFDPRISLLVMEEPENNVHPWAIRTFAKAFRAASEEKQIILTTHSPILVDQFKPEELWIVQKPGTTTRIDPLLKLDPSLKNSWQEGRFTLSEYLDSGALPEAVPIAS